MAPTRAGPASYEHCAAPTTGQVAQWAGPVRDHRQPSHRGRLRPLDFYEVIFELVYGIAVRDTIAESEAALLNELATVWGLPQRVGEVG